MKNLRLAFKLADLARGTRAEMEHARTLRKIKRPEVTVREAAKEIAKDHLKEDPAYYAKLEEVKAKRQAPGVKPPRIRLLWRKGKLRIYEVDGIAVRKMEIAFTMGGHDLVYPGLVPANEVWIDNALNAQDQMFTTLHELHERRLMATRGMGYDEAHESANQIESHYRKRNGRGLKRAFARERGQ